MSRPHDLSRSRLRPLIGLAAIGVVALALAGCGRKGPLDLPPGAAAPAEQQTAAPGLVSPIGVTPIGGGTPSNGNAGIGPDGQVRAPQGQKRWIPLDVLLN